MNPAINETTGRILDAAFKVHSSLGPGLPESAYQECLYYELVNGGLEVRKEYPLPVVYEEVRLECGYRADLFVKNMVIVEVKSTETTHDIHLAQVLTYLKLANCQIGLLLNFNVLHMKKGIKRVYNKYYHC